VGKHRGKRTWEDNIKVDLREAGCEDQKWEVMIQDRVQ